MDGGSSLSSRSRSSASSQGPSSPAAVATSPHYSSIIHVSSSFTGARIRRVLSRTCISLLRVDDRSNESHPTRSSRGDAFIARRLSFTDTSSSKTMHRRPLRLLLNEDGVFTARLLVVKSPKNHYRKYVRATPTISRCQGRVFFA